MWRAHRFAKSFPRAGAAVQCASSRTSVASQDAHSNLRSLKCGPVWTTLTSHIDSPQEGQCGRSVTNTIEVKTKSVRGTAGSGSGADGARSAVKRLIHGAGSLPWSTEKFTSRFTSTDVVISPSPAPWFGSRRTSCLSADKRHSQIFPKSRLGQRPAHRLSACRNVVRNYKTVFLLFRPDRHKRQTRSQVGSIAQDREVGG